MRRFLFTIILREEIDGQEIKDICDKLDTGIALENVMSAVDKLFDRYKVDKDIVEVLRCLGMK